MKKKLFAFVFLITSLTMFGQEINSVRFENIIKILKLNKKNIKIDLCTEKKMQNEDLYIIVLPIILYEDEYSFSVQNYILITYKQGVIENQYKEKDVLDSDAIRLSSFTIDTAFYQLNNSVIAFGIRAKYLGSSHANPYSSEDISVFYTIKGSLKKILSRFEVHSYSGEWDTRCAGEFEDEESVIIVDKLSTNNFADLKIKTKITKIKNKEINNDCKEFKTSKTAYKTLRFSKGIYK